MLEVCDRTPEPAAQLTVEERVDVPSFVFPGPF